MAILGIFGNISGILGFFGIDYQYFLGQPSPHIPQVALINPPTPIATLVSEKDQMVMVAVPAGPFTMGSDEGDAKQRPAHEVFLDAYWIDQSEVTNSMYAFCVTDGQCTKTNYESKTRENYYDNPVYADFPVVYVSWYDADRYCRWARRRLPTEAEWEKAARGAEGNKYPWGNEPPNSSLLNYAEENGDTTRVASFPFGVSPYGAFDMAGNLYEWVADVFDENYYRTPTPQKNPSGPVSGPRHVVRGGSFINEKNDSVSTTFRFGLDVNNRDDFGAGFRCALSTP